MILSNFGWSNLLGCLLIALAPACATSNVATSEAGTEHRSIDARTQVANLLLQAKQHVDSKPAEAAKRLEAAWKLSTQLVDDRIVRAAIAEFPRTHATPILKRVALVAEAQDAFAENAASKVQELLAKKHDAYDLTEARRLLLLSLVQVSASPSEAKLALLRVANGGLESASGRELQNMARTTAASIDFDQEKLGDAIRKYLRVSEESAYWPTARTAISWAQFQLKKYERAIAGLKLLPGGITGAPDRALLGAVCLHHLGKVEAARALISNTQSNQKTWFAGNPSASAVLSVIDNETTPPGVLTAVAWHPPIRLLGREIAATDELLGSAASDSIPAIKRYRQKAWQKFESMVTRKVSGARDAAKIAYEKLTILAPQLK